MDSMCVQCVAVSEYRLFGRFDLKCMGGMLDMARDITVIFRAGTRRDWIVVLIVCEVVLREL